MATTAFAPTDSTPQDKETSWVRRLLRQEVYSPEYQQLKFTLHRKLLDRVNLEAISSLPTAEVKEQIRAMLGELVEDEEKPLSLPEKERVVSEVLDEVFGLGPLETLLQDPTVSDILVTGPDLVYVERNGRLSRTGVRFKDDRHLLRIIEKVVSRVGRRVDESSPLVDARLPDGSRVNAVVAPIALDGPMLSIRRFGKRPLVDDDLVRNLTMTEEIRTVLKACVEARLNIVITGGTGAGKTTLLNVVSSYISNDERIVTIEDAAELRMQQVHVGRMETRPANIEGRGAIRIRDLVINALRMRPDRIIVGEVRGEECLDMLQAMNTGHDGSLTTVHANSPRDAISRLEVMVGMANANMGVRSIRQQIASAVHLFVHLARLSDGSRRVTHVTECTGMEGDQITLQNLFVFERSGLTKDRRVKGRFRATGVRPKFDEVLRASGLELSEDLFRTIVEIE